MATKQFAPLAVSTPHAAELLDVGLTKLNEMLKPGPDGSPPILESKKIGRSRRVIMTSIEKLLMVETAPASPAVEIDPAAPAVEIDPVAPAPAAKPKPRFTRGDTPLPRSADG
jgi:hypothetical protein